MRFQVERARHYYERGNKGIHLLHRDGRFSVQIASDVYREILANVEMTGFNVFEQRAVVSTRRKYMLTARNLAAPAARTLVKRSLFWRTS
jgi:phytoene synthase